MKVVINHCYGGFGLSTEACKELRVRGVSVTLAGEEYRDGSGIARDSFPDQRDESLRSDPRLVEVVELLGDAANGAHAELKVVEIPDDVAWHIQEYDGMEWVAENHRTWS